MVLFFSFGCHNAFAAWALFFACVQYSAQANLKLNFCYDLDYMQLFYKRIEFEIVINISELSL